MHHMVQKKEKKFFPKNAPFCAEFNMPLFIVS